MKNTVLSLRGNVVSYTGELFEVIFCSKSGGDVNNAKDHVTRTDLSSGIHVEKESVGHVPESELHYHPL